MFRSFFFFWRKTLLHQSPFPIPCLLVPMNFYTLLSLMLLVVAIQIFKRVKEVQKEIFSRLHLTEIIIRHLLIVSPGLNPWPWDGYQSVNRTTTSKTGSQGTQLYLQRIWTSLRFLHQRTHSMQSNSSYGAITSSHAIENY